MSPIASASPSTPRTGARMGLQSSIDAHGLKASDTGDASLRPTSFTAKARQTYSVPFVRPISCAVGFSTDARSRTLGQVAPLSGEHSKCRPEAPANRSAATLTFTAPLSASTDGLPGGPGWPIGMTVPVTGVHGPSPVALTAATSHV